MVSIYHGYKGSALSKYNIHLRKNVDVTWDSGIETINMEIPV